MKICIPVKENKGLDSIAFNHFGSAPFFLIYDLENEKINVIPNGDLHHAHGMCQPLKALNGEMVDVILTGGIGVGAIRKLNAQGIKIYKVKNETALKNIELLKENALMEFSIEQSCSHDGCAH